MWDQAVVALRWYVDGTRVKQLARDARIGLSTAYRYIDGALGVLAKAMPSLAGALLAAKIAGHDRVMIDGTLIPTDRLKVPGPTKGVDLWWSGKHKKHGGNVQVVTAADGWPIWVSPVCAGRTHDTTAARTHEGLLNARTPGPSMRPARRPGTGTRWPTSATSGKQTVSRCPSRRPRAPP
ncbi:hypothetical protein GCM10009809_39870 [Isoptericola hypogeus]|uniref:DDE Tnp4 domain-containing protein n=1 Tax=Isoptericola hypogeus TaxID=300179 RepID=A0ABP4VZG6_9MICO